MSNIKILAAKFEKIASRCNCEHVICEHSKKNKGCSNKAGKKKALYIGALCDECAKHYSPEFMKKDAAKEKTEEELIKEEVDTMIKRLQQAAKGLDHRALKTLKKQLDKIVGY
jgi:hypothetical protein